MTLVHAVVPPRFTYNRVEVEEPSTRIYREPLVAVCDGAPTPAVTTKFDDPIPRRVEAVEDISASVAVLTAPGNDGFIPFGTGIIVIG